MNKNTTFGQPFELITQKFLSKIKYGELIVKFPSGSIKTFKGNDNSYTADLTLNNYKNRILNQYYCDQYHHY